MKRLLDFMMNNKFFLIVFAIVVFGLKFFLGNYAIPDKFLPLISILKKVFLIVFIFSVLYVLVFFVLALASGKKSEHWWDSLDGKKTDNSGLLKLYVQALMVAIPVAIYGTLIYLAVFQSWKSILTFIIAFIISRMVYQFQQKRRESFQRNVQ